jgi:hypothetical protein
MLETDSHKSPSTSTSSVLLDSYFLVSWPILVFAEDIVPEIFCGGLKIDEAHCRGLVSTSADGAFASWAPDLLRLYVVIFRRAAELL